VDVAVLLVLPLVGGYVFARTCVFTRYECSREDGHRLYFRAAFWGAGLFLAALAIHFTLATLSHEYKELVHFLQGPTNGLFKDASKSDPIAPTIAGVSSLFLAYPFAKFLNLILWKWKGTLLQRACEQDDFERILYQAVSRDMPVSVSMENRKVYVGFVLRTFEPTKTRKSITVLPLMSGYRGDTDGRLVFTTFYDWIYGANRPKADAGKLSPPFDHLSAQDFEIVLPMDRVHSLGLFDVNVYAAFSARGTSNSGAPQPSSANTAGVDAVSSDNTG
jgi:hypothetical protein